MVQGAEEARPAGAEGSLDDTPALLAAARAGDPAANAALLDRYRPLLATVVARHGRRLPRGAFAADDLWQEAFRHFLELVAAYHPGAPEGFGPYLKRLLDWRIANFVRAEQRRQRRSEPLAPGHLDLRHDELRPDLGPGLENPRLRAAVRQLSPRQRSVLFHLHCQGRAVPEVAAALGLTPQAVTALRRRAEGLLRRALKK